MFCFETDDVRSLSLPGTYHVKIGCLENSLKHFTRLKSLDLSRNALGSLAVSHCYIVFVQAHDISSQLPKLCVKISILMHRCMWVRSFSTRLTSVTFAEDKVLIFLILRKNARIVQL